MGTATLRSTRTSVGTWPQGTMTALAIHGPGEVGPVTLPIPRPKPGAVLVRPRYLGLCGTDLELLHGNASYLRDGRASYPHVFGHEWWGEIIAVADDVAAFAPGQDVVGHTMVSCGLCPSCQRGRRSLCQRLVEVGLYGLPGAAAEYISMPAHALTQLPKPSATPCAVTIEPAVTVVEAFDRAGCDLNDRVAVVGTGTIGLLAVQLARRLAGRVEAIGVDPAGLDLAVRCGATAVHLSADAPEESYSLVVEASGAASAFSRSLRLVETGGRVAVVGVAAQPSDAVVAGDIALRGISILGIRHGLDHYERTIRLLTEGVLGGEQLLAGIFPPAQAPQAFALLEHGRSGPPKVVLDLTAGWEALGANP